MNENIITWNVTNWVTIVLMASLGFMILGILSSVVRGKRVDPRDDLDNA